MPLSSMINSEFSFLSCTGIDFGSRWSETNYPFQQKTLKLRLSLFCIESVLIIQRKTEQIRVSKNKQQNLKIEIF